MLLINWAVSQSLPLLAFWTTSTQEVILSHGWCISSLARNNLDLLLVTQLSFCRSRDSHPWGRRVGLCQRAQSLCTMNHRMEHVSWALPFWSVSQMPTGAELFLLPTLNTRAGRSPLRALHAHSPLCRRPGVSLGYISQRCEEPGLLDQLSSSSEGTVRVLLGPHDTLTQCTVLVQNPFSFKSCRPFSVRNRMSVTKALLYFLFTFGGFVLILWYFIRNCLHLCVSHHSPCDRTSWTAATHR